MYLHALRTCIVIADNITCYNQMTATDKQISENDM